MRAAPVGIFPSISAVTKRSRVQAALTHNTDAGLDVASAVAFMAHYCVYALGVFLKNHVSGRWTGLRPGRAGAKRQQSAAAAAAPSPRHDSPRALVQDCVSLPGTWTPWPPWPWPVPPARANTTTIRRRSWMRNWKTVPGTGIIWLTWTSA